MSMILDAPIISAPPTATPKSTIAAVAGSTGNKVLLVVIGIPVIVWLGGTAYGSFINLTLVAVLFTIVIGNVTASAKKKASGN